MPPAAPVLVSAAFDVLGPTLTLVFDRALAFGPGAPGNLTVADGPGGNRYDAGGGTSLAGPVTVVVNLSVIDVASGPDVVLDAPPPTGIVGEAGGLAWAGASGLVLPFP